jgi:hypothetical protein
MSVLFIFVIRISKKNNVFEYLERIKSLLNWHEKRNDGEHFACYFNDSQFFMPIPLPSAPVDDGTTKNKIHNFIIANG